MRRVLLLALGVCLLGVFVSPALAAPEIQNPDLISDKSYTLEYDLAEGESVENVVGDGAVKVDSHSRNGNTLVVEVSTKQVSEETSGSVYLQTNENEERSDFTVVPAGGGGGESGSESSGSFEDQWINRRVNEIQTDRGVITVYEQRDPTRGEIDPETGIPRGEWVEVPVNENAEPQWLFTNKQELAVYMATKANTRYAERTRVYLSAGGIVVLSLLLQWVALPKLRKRREENWWYGDNSKEGDQTGGFF